MQDNEAIQLALIFAKNLNFMYIKDVTFVIYQDALGTIPLRKILKQFEYSNIIIDTNKVPRYLNTDVDCAKLIKEYHDSEFDSSLLFKSFSNFNNLHTVSFKWSLIRTETIDFSAFDSLKTIDINMVPSLLSKRDFVEFPENFNIILK